jgi:pyruvate formate lyase activating enzyme
MRVEQVLAEVLQDLAFYRNSGGGVTLSGGEPLSQSAFARALLECCQAEGIHTAIETAANCPWHTLLEILPFTDLVMMDLKLMDASKHRALTGVSNAQILANARRLMQTDKSVIFRVPIVPTVNDTVAEIGTVASFVRSLAELRLESSHMGANAPLPTVELLPFHPLAADKYRSLGWDYRASRLKPPTVEKMEQLRHTVTSQGVKCRE